MNSTDYLKKIIPVILLLIGLNDLHGEVIDSSAAGFTVKNSIIIAADTNEVYYSLVDDIGDWWDPAHTYSGNAQNLSIDDKAGGCFCEQLNNGGSVDHMEVVFVAPKKTLRLRGALGPLQAMAVTGSMSWNFSGIDAATKVEVTYSVGGYRPGGLQILASIVDKVLFDQLKRFKEYIEHKKVKQNK